MFPATRKPTGDIWAFAGTPRGLRNGSVRVMLNQNVS